MNIKTFLITTVLLFNTLALAKEPQLIYAEAFQAFDTQDYKTAYSKLKEYLEYDRGNKPVQFYVARSAYEIKKYEEALALYTQILKTDPDMNRVKFEIAKTYFMLKDYDKAKEKLEYLLKQSIPEEINQDAQSILSTIEEKTKKHSLKATLFVGIVQDSNIHNASAADEYSFYLPELDLYWTTNNEDKKQSDQIIQTLVSLNSNYKIDEDLFLESKGVFGKYTYHHNHDKDLGIVSLSTALSRFENNTKTSLGISFDSIYEGGSHYVNGINFFIPRLDIKIDETTLYTGYIKYNKKLFSRISDNDKDSHSIELYNGISTLDDTWGKNTLALSLGKTKKESGARTDIDLIYSTLSFENNYILSSDLLLNSQVSLQNSSYEDLDENFVSKREDTQYSFESTLLKTFNKNTILGLGFRYIDTNSNHSPFDYNKYLIRSFATYVF